MLNPPQGNRDFLQRPAVYVIMNNSYTCWFSSIGFPTHSGSLSSPFGPASHPGRLTARAASTPLAGSSAGSEVGRRERDPSVPASSNQPENPAEAINPLKSDSLEKIWLTPPPQLGSRVKCIAGFWDSNKLGKQKQEEEGKNRERERKYWIPVCTTWHYYYFVASRSSLRLCFPSLWM